MGHIPRILAQAKVNLTEPTQEMSKLALPALADARQSSRNFARSLAAVFPPEQAGELMPAAEIMGAAFEDYARWIEARLPHMARAQPLGQEMYDWILRRIWLLPFDAHAVRELGEQEYGR